MMKLFSKPEYQRIVDATINNQILKIEFKNGDIIELPITKLLPMGINDIKPLDIKFNYFEITIITEKDNIEIPWDKIRVISDSSFSRYLADKTIENAQQIGVKIKSLREKKGLKSNELAERSGLTPQTITRIERGYTDVSFTNLRKILIAMGYSLKDLANQENELELSEKNFNNLLKRLTKIGIDPKFLIEKIIPPKIQSALGKIKGSVPELLLNEVLNYITYIYGWTSDQIWSDNLIDFNKEAYLLAYFKRPKNLSNNQIIAYSHYAYALTQITIKALNIKRKRQFPGDIEEVKYCIKNEYKDLSFESILKYVWSLGIVVLPLNDSGIFHGACWNINNQYVIVLKNKSNSHARWSFDLLHELYHVFVHLQANNSGIVELEELQPFLRDEAIEESEANSFANKILLDQRAEELADKCIEEANYKLENLKFAVLKVAKLENIPADILANYLAYRLSYQGENWWGASNNLQITSPDVFSLTAKTLSENIKYNLLNPIEMNLLKMAISAEEQL